MAGVEIKGLSQTKDNFNKLNQLAQNEIGRQSLRDSGWTLAKAMRAATYTTFHRQTGVIRSGLSVAVEHDPKNARLKGWVVEYRQTIVGTNPATVLFRKHFRLKGHRPPKKQGGGGARVDLSGVAYWWRFLEFGTGPRRSSATPRFLRSGRIAKREFGRERQLRGAQRWKASPFRGGIAARSWLRPVFSGGTQSALGSLRDTFLKLVDAAVSAMPKQ